MADALRRADRMKVETIGGETFVNSDLGSAELRRDLHEIAMEPMRVPKLPQPNSVAMEEGGFRAVPTTLSVDPQADKLAKVKAIRAQAQAFKALLRELGSNRSFSISRQRIEEAVHWAVDGIINERSG
jgi:hypothetical protein